MKIRDAKNALKRDKMESALSDDEDQKKKKPKQQTLSGSSTTIQKETAC